MQKQNRKQNKKNGAKGGNPRARRATNSSVGGDNALMLRPEFIGQPVTELKIQSTSGVLGTTVTTGLISLNQSLNSTLIANFTTRFAGFAEFRIVKVMSKLRLFSSTNPGIISQWFSEDDSAANTAAKAANAAAQRISCSAVERVHTLTYVPHDPAQQTWTLVSSGAPVVGYHKVYTDAANYGSSIVATPYAYVEYDIFVQFRGLI